MFDVSLRQSKMTSPNSILVLVFFFCSAISFLMSGMEAGVLALSPLRIRQLRRRGNVNAEVLYGFLERPENFLLTILAGNTVANFTIFALVAMKLHDWLLYEPWLAVLIFFAIIFFFFSVFELVAKMVFLLFSYRFPLFLARSFR